MYKPTNKCIAYMLYISNRQTMTRIMLYIDLELHLDIDCVLIPCNAVKGVWSIMGQHCKWLHTFYLKVRYT